LKPNLRYASSWVDRETIRDACLIALLAVLSGLAFNFLRQSPIPLFHQAQSKGVKFFSSFDEMRSLIKEGAIIVDARPEKLYNLGHIPAARSLPFEEAARKLPPFIRDLDPKDRLVVYCSEPLCPLAENLAYLIIDQGFANLSVFSPGYDGWLNFGGQAELSSGIMP
jgi:rhodanese-related sulfurtransferase